MNRDAFKDIREALTEESERLEVVMEKSLAPIKDRLDRINGSVGRHEGRLADHEIELVRIKTEHDTEQRLVQALSLTAQIDGKKLTVGHEHPEHQEPTGELPP